MKNSIQTYWPFYSFCWFFQLAPVHASVPSAHWEGSKPDPEQAWLTLNELALVYIAKPTDIDSGYVLKRWESSRHRRITLASGKE